MALKHCLQALARGHTYDVRRNPWIRLGFLTALGLALLPLAVGQGGWIRGALLAQPFLLGLAFGVVGTLRRDQSRRAEARLRDLTEQAMTDPLTGLYNRRFVDEELKNLLLRARRSGEPVTVVFFDLDDFKAVNARWGHRGGDVMLQEVAGALKSVVRQGETLARYGGDEFVLVVPGDLRYARSLVDRAVESVRRKTRLVLSAGLAMAPPDGETPEALLAAADASLHDIKRMHHEEQSVRPTQNEDPPSRFDADARFPRHPPVSRGMAPSGPPFAL